MSDQPSGKKVFWQTMPRILTGTAAVLTATVGLVTLLAQLGIIGGPDKTPPADPLAGTATTATATATTPAPARTTTAAVAADPWDSAKAVMTANDGKVYTSRAATFRFCVSGGAGIHFDKRQDIAFNLMTSIEILRSDVALTPGGVADIRITLAKDGSVLTGTMDAGCDFIMFTDLGRVALYPDKVKKIEFQRP